MVLILSGNHIHVEIVDVFFSTVPHLNFAKSELISYLFNYR